MALAILHREPGTETVPEGALVWRTCLREVQFVDEPDGDQPVMHTPHGQRLQDGYAYKLLLEILCGLQSPMIGETQVLGQFKSFLADSIKVCPWLNRVGQRLLNDARDIRTKHLQGLGSRSYGSAVRRDLADVDQAVLIGTGKLAQEVLPFLTDGARFVDQWGRAAAADVPATAGVTYHTLDSLSAAEPSPLATAIVVAAPVSPEVIERVAALYPSLRRIIDLRADVGDRPLAVTADIISLQDLFSRMHASQASAAPQIEAARKEIAWRTRQYELRDELRPFGWDDLCA